MTVGSPQQCNQQSRNPIQPLSSAERADDVFSVYHNKNSPAVTEPLRKRTLSSKPQTFRSPLKQEKKAVVLWTQLSRKVQGDVCAEVYC